MFVGRYTESNLVEDGNLGPRGIGERNLIELEAAFGLWEADTRGCSSVDQRFTVDISTQLLK